MQKENKRVEARRVAIARHARLWGLPLQQAQEKFSQQNKKWQKKQVNAVKTVQAKAVTT